VCVCACVFNVHGFVSEPTGFSQFRRRMAGWIKKLVKLFIRRLVSVAMCSLSYFGWNVPETLLQYGYVLEGGNLNFVTVLSLP